VFLFSDNDSDTEQALQQAKAIFEREGVPSLARVGDVAAYGFVLINMLGQPSEFRSQFIEKLREASMRHELPDDAVLFAEARLRQAEMEERYQNQLPTSPLLRSEILRLYEADQSVRQKAAFDLRKMEQTDTELAPSLKRIYSRYGVPTYDMVGVDAAKAFLVMVQHQSPDLRRLVLPRLKENVDAGQGDAATYAMVYDRTQRDQGRNQLYGEQLECSQGNALKEAPIDDESNVNHRRARLGLMRMELHARLVRLHSPDMCGSQAQ
jgi:hypothetical protein